MKDKALPYTLVVAAVVATGVGSYLLGHKLGVLIAHRYIIPRITEITVWNGPIPTHPSSR